MTAEQQPGAAASSPQYARAMAAAHNARTHPQLARGIVWSDLVREMDEEQAVRLSTLGTVTALPGPGAGAAVRDDVLGEAA